jgi:pyruvate kinase
MRQGTQVIDRSLTRIVATVGPASNTIPVLDALIRAGVSIVRLNFSHGSLEQHHKTLAAIRTVEQSTGQVTAVLADLPGPKIRVGQAPLEGIDLQVGQVVRIRPGAHCSIGPEPTLACTYAGIVDDAEAGHRVLIDDGAVRLLVIDRREGALVCTTLTGGIVRTGKGINLPDSPVRADPITERDLAGAEFAVANEIDFVGMSFVQDPEDIRRLRGAIEQFGRRLGRHALPQIVAKIERPQAIDRVEEIVRAADAVMVARGDLGVEMDVAKVPVLQKRILAAARAEGKPSIVATQMLQSMVDVPVPTRAEVSDVANAILDGCDAVMLSGETAVGKWPVVTVETMVRIAREAERYLAETSAPAEPPARLVRERDRVAALAHGASRSARDLGVARVVAWSQTGVTALLLSRYGFIVPVLAASTDLAALRRMRILRGVEPMLVETPPASFLDFVSAAERSLRERGVARTGDLVLVVSGERFGVGAPSALMALREIGSDDGSSPPAGGADGGGGA